MIRFIDIDNSAPFKLLKESYDKASASLQPSIEALSVASYNPQIKEVSSRYVNLKIVDGNKFIFFTNYNSRKAHDFQLHEQIAAILFWPKINMQIRIMANITKTSKSYNQMYFEKRLKEKNALAISSQQSQPINSFQDVVKKYENTLAKSDLSQCPNYWGGYAFTPFEIEFWEGYKYRLNKRSLYKNINGKWNHFILEP